jgi:arylsulfatase
MKVSQVVSTVRWTAAFALAGISCVAAEIQTTGTPGSPGATTTLSGKQLPPPAQEFGGVIKEKAVDSKPWWPPTVVSQKRT